MNFIQSFNNKTILIPLLQRDYVQGGQEDIIGPFIDSLLEKEVDLNYIYGYEEDGCFVPVDGQQRLTTPWLLYLYLFARKQQKKDFNVSMKFTAREYAEDFCDRLSENLECLLCKLSDKESLDEAIINQNWLIRSWLSNVSVKNMLSTLRIIHRKINQANFLSIWNRLVESSVPSISFSFLQMGKENGLDDDIYIKMNGRGRKLSAFENIKSYMDEHISGLTFADKWKSKMDNAWTDMFWTNRNEQKEQPEEIDNEQLYCLYNLLILYHINREELSNTLTRIKEEQHLYEDLTVFLKTSEHTEENELISSIIKKLQKAENFPLIWFERLHLMSDGFYEFAFNNINKLTALSKDFNALDIYIGASSSETTTRTYQICMCEGSFDRTLPLLYALLSYNEGETPLYDWMRTMRNLILNTEIESKDLPKIMQAIDKFSLRCGGMDIYTVLQSDDAKSALKGFNANQVDEEIMKAHEREEYYEQMTSLENGRFFSGCIGILFRMLSHDESESYDLISQESVTAYSSVLLELFNGDDNGISARFNDDSFLLRRALMSYPPFRFGTERSKYWSFNKGIDEWREYIKNKESDIRALRSLMKDLLIPAFKSDKDLCNVLSEYVERISKDYEKDILIKDDCSHRYHFIHHPGIWEYMQTQRCKWNDNNFDIELKTSNGNNSNRMELRTMSLYLDYKYNEDYIPDWDGWEIYKWEREKSCLYFKFKTNDGIAIEIDVYFHDDNGNRSREKCYAFDLFVCQSEDKDGESAFAEDDNCRNYRLFSSVIPEHMGLFRRKESGHLHCERLYARHELRAVLRNIMGDIKSAFAKDTQVRDEA